MHPRTFFRHFATKADVVFAESQRTDTEFVAALYAQPPDVPVTRAIARVVGDSAGQPPSADDIARYHIVAATPSLLEAATARQTRSEQQLVRWIAQRNQLPEDDVDVRVVAAALVAAKRVVMEVGIASGVTDREEIVALAERALSAIAPPFERHPPQP